MSGPVDFYRAFEDRHRGTRESIQARLGAYLTFLRPLARLFPQSQAADLGCGRGEWLELLGAQGFEAQGVDLDEGMLQACRERGLDTRRDDALGFLKGLPDDSRTVVSAFHLAEHLPFEDLQALVAQALRVLRPGGLLILETPNPENLVVGSSAFYMDPTHERPLPPQLLEFLPAFHGFGRVKTLRLQEGIQQGPAVRLGLIDVLAGVSPDYAVIAQKGSIAANGDPARIAALIQLDTAFARDYGVTLNQLAERYDREWQARLDEVRAATELARQAALAAQSENRRALEFAGALQERLLGELRTTHLELRASHQQLLAVTSSRSWRVTRPLRWSMAQAQALREQGPVGRARHIAGRSVRVGARLAAASLNRFPSARRAAGRLVRALGLGDWIDSARSRMSEPVAPPQPSSMSATTRRIHDSLKHLLATQAPQDGKKDS